MARVSRNASIPYLPYSRPTPEYLNPPRVPADHRPGDLAGGGQAIYPTASDSTSKRTS